jgi:prephenate dehydrogenase
VVKRREVKPKQLKPLDVVIVGFGRLGGAIALGLKAAGWKVSVLARSGDAVRRAAQRQIRLADHDDLREASLCLLAVADGAVGAAIELVEEDLGPGTALVHLSGALPLSIFSTAKTRRPFGSFHPLAAISDADDELVGHAVALASNDKTLTPKLERLAAAL